jgi:tubulin--tyrosine ligase-like protein 12
VREQLQAVPPLLERMENLMQLTTEQTVQLSNEERVAAVADRVWRYANTYSLGNLKPEEASAIWYVMDEVGSAIEHGDEPNVRMAPFYFAHAQCAFSLVWTVQPVEGGDFLSRDYFSEFAADAAMHKALLAALFYEPGKTDSPYVDELQEIVAGRKQQYTLEKARAKFHAIVSRDSETLPDPATTVSSPPLSTVIAGADLVRVCSGT